MLDAGHTAGDNSPPRRIAARARWPRPGMPVRKLTLVRDSYSEKGTLKWCRARLMGQLTVARFIGATARRISAQVGGSFPPGCRSRPTGAAVSCWLSTVLCATSDAWGRRDLYGTGVRGGLRCDSGLLCTTPGTSLLYPTLSRGASSTRGRHRQAPVEVYPGRGSFRQGALVATSVVSACLYTLPHPAWIHAWGRRDLGPVAAYG